VRELLTEGTEQSGLSVVDANPMADMIVARLGSVGCKIGLRLTERAVAMTGRGMLKKIPEKRKSHPWSLFWMTRRVMK
jgi:hypothetical protein